MKTIVRGMPALLLQIQLMQVMTTQETHQQSHEAHVQAQSGGSGSTVNGTTGATTSAATATATATATAGSNPKPSMLSETQALVKEMRVLQSE